MGINHQGPIVTNGLVLCLDAANPKSYPGTGTIWSDLSGNGNNGTLVNGPTYSANNNGSLVFDGINDYATLNENIYLNYNKTFIFWLMYSEPFYGGHLLNFSTGNYRNRVFIFSNTIELYNSDSVTTISFTFSENITSKIKQIGFTVDNSNIFLIENGVITQTTPITFPNGQRTFTHLGLQSSGSGIGFFNGKIYNFSHYNRALSATEIQQNFNALRGRYGI